MIKYHCQGTLQKNKFTPVYPSRGIGVHHGRGMAANGRCDDKSRKLRAYILSHKLPAENKLGIAGSF